MDTGSVNDLKALIKRADDAGQSALQIVLLEKLLAVKPDSTYYRYLYGDALRTLGRLNEAQAVLESTDVAQIPPEKVYLLYLSLAELFRDRGDLRQAGDWFRRALQSRPDATVPYVYYGGFLARQGLIEEAVSVYEAALERASGDIDEVWLNLGNCRRAQSRLVEAAECYRRAIALDAEYTTARESLDDVNSALAALKRDSGGGSEGNDHPGG